MSLQIWTLILACLALKVLASGYIPDDLDVIKALSGIGITPSSAPELSNVAQQTLASSCASACTILEQLHGEDAIHRAEDHSYSNFTESYWSANQAEVRPRCVFTPSDHKAVQSLVLVARHTKCPFAVKSGGHAAFPGASSIEDGITVSLQNLNHVALSADGKTAHVQSGIIAYNLYIELARHDLTVLAARGATLGMGGFTLGGGISFLSSRYGFACDNVASYKVVTADGQVTTASPGENPDLYWALRGGGNNFGIVTSFEVETFPLPNNEMWQTNKLYSGWWSSAKVIDAFAHAVTQAPKDPDAGFWVTWVKVKGIKLASTQLWSGNPSGGDSVVFEKFPTGPAYTDSTKVTLASMTRIVEGNNRYGMRECYYHTTTKADPRILQPALDAFWDLEGAFDKVQGSLLAFVWQAITEPTLRAMEKNGGNPLGLSVDDGPYYVLQLTTWWDKAEDDDLVHSTMSKILDRVNAEAAALGCQNDFVYMNYASRFQDVISSYGAANKARLQSIAKQYDPTGVFQTLQPGYFKLEREPTQDPGYFSYPSARLLEADHATGDKAVGSGKDEL